MRQRGDESDWMLSILTKIMILNIAYACNEAYVNHTGISMISLFENNKDIEDINVYLINKDITDNSKNILQNLISKYHRKLHLIAFDSLCEELQIGAVGRHIETIYAKLFFSEFEACDKILYLDSDTIVAGSLRELWRIDMGDNLVGGVQTIASRELKAEIMMGRDDKFINDGIVLINLKAWREHNIEEKFVEFIA
ncbi:MAG TPA: glycosyltransferase, partial [Legionellaceae bacterium]|nr:glycosyltransferase [Legionellaceae bacterium]